MLPETDGRAVGGGVSKPRAVDAFCGAGGASQGLHDAGFDVVGFDHWQPAVDTHNANGLVAHLHDLSDPSIDDLIPDCALMWLSCPCQPFSAAGDGGGEFDERDGFPWGLRIVAARLPAVAIFENVKGLTFGKHHAYFAGFLESLRALGYDVQWRVLNSADYGVPQTRERTFIVCRRDGGAITWPMPTHTEQPGMFTDPWVTMAAALGWDASAELVGNNSIAGGPLARRPASGQAMTLGVRGDLWTLDYRQTNRAGEPIYCDLTERPAPTVGTMSGGQWIVEPGTIRLSISDLAALQGFPADWQWTGTKTAQARQVGNAVPPIMAQVLAAANRPLLATCEVAA